MRFMAIVPAGGGSEEGKLPPPELFAAMGRFNGAMAKAGVLMSAEGLAPSARGARIRYEGGTTTVRDGPFTESKELIAGFWILQVKSKDEAVAWLRQAPFGGGVEVELREIQEMDDLPPEIRKAAGR